jgi:pimeloyl-ACP methyl ester carboxylesterase
MRLRLGSLAAVALLPLGLVACQGSDDPEPKATAPRLAPVECPPQVDDVLMSGYTCATLTTSGSAGRTPVRLLVTTIEPADGAATQDPIIVVGADLATAINYAGIAPAADRMDRTLVILSPRGVVGADPDLSCPEVDELEPVAPVGGTEAWTEAVDRCATRLAEAGVDVEQYGQEQMATDVLDLVDALGVSSWNLGVWGTSGRVALEVLRSGPEGLRAVFMDSPELPSDDTLGTAGARTTAALTRVLDACTDDRRCSRLPHSLADVDRIAAALDAAPLTTTVDHDGQPVDVTVEGDLLVRLLRQMIADSGVHSQYFAAGAVPALLASAEARDATALATVVQPLLSSVTYCEGYVPLCAPYQRITLGAYLPTVCSHAADPLADDAVPEALRHTFDDDPYRAACGRWPTAAPLENEDQIESDVPVLVLTGALDPYVDVAPESWRAALSGLSRLTAVEVPGWGHNVMTAGDCPVTMRNRFVAHPERPVDESCLAKLPTMPEFLEHL